MARYSCREQKTSTTRSMARAGDVIENPFSGEWIRFDETSAETGGEYLAGEIVLAPHGIGPPEHVHPVIEERFRVLSGTLTSLVRGEKVAAGVASSRDVRRHAKVAGSGEV